MTCHRVENVIREQERESICDRCSIKFAVVDIDVDFPVFLGDDYDWALTMWRVLQVV